MTKTTEGDEKTDERTSLSMVRDVLCRLANEQQETIDAIRASVKAKREAYIKEREGNDKNND